MEHWCHQLWGMCPPPRLPAILGITRFTDSEESCAVERFLAIGSADCHWIVENVQKQRNFAQFLSMFGPFLSFFAHSFPQGVIIVPKMPEDRQ